MNKAASQSNSSSALERASVPSARVIIDGIAPAIEAGSYPVKRVTGDILRVEADVFADGHEKLKAAVALRPQGARNWARHLMEPLGNDRWAASISFAEPGLWQFRVEGWIDSFGGFLRDTAKKREAGLSLAVEAQEGRALVAAARERAPSSLKPALDCILKGLENHSVDDCIALLLSDETGAAMGKADSRPYLTTSFIQPVQVDCKRAGFASWYELFPRSQTADSSRHGTFRDTIDSLPRIRDMGFDVLYLTPIHPIGSTNRKGRNNALSAGPGEPGSPYAIGSQAGGHDALHPDLGTQEDFRALVNAARAEGLEIALDIAVQMSPDHPWLTAHPEWFQRRPDGSMKYAENPPKKYEDIVNPDFYTDKALWCALRDVFLYWTEQGVRIFRVDNPHTKPFAFWEWVISEVRSRHPDTIFLSEAFTRPKLMYHLAKIGFTQSYTYFTWRNTKRELTDYIDELNRPPASDYFRPNFFVNTPDINPYFLQTGGRPAFLIRAALAATLSGLWGMYSGFELCEAAPLPGREEYLDSEKYEIRPRNFDKAGNIAAEITQLNELRRCEPALQSHLGTTFYNAFNDSILYYGRCAPGRDDRILIAVNLDPHNAQAANFEIPLWEWGLPDHESLNVEDLIHGDEFTWSGKVQHMHLEPATPYAIWRVRPRRRV